MAENAWNVDFEIQTINLNNVDISTYRKLVQTYLNLHVYDAALFWADKVVALTSGNPKDVYWLAQCMFLLKQYHRAAHLLRSRNLDKTYVLCNYLTVRCLLEANELNEALNILNSIDTEVLLQNPPPPQNISEADNGMFDDTPKYVQSSVLLLKGKVLEAMDNRSLAADCYKQALQCDVHCYEAFDALIKHHMLSAVDEHTLLNSLPISQQCKPEEAKILHILYKSKLKKYHIVSAINPCMNADELSIPTIVPPLKLSNPFLEKTEEETITKTQGDAENMNVDGSDNVGSLQDSLDLLASKAEQFYYDCDYFKCNKLTDRILKQDPYHSSCLPIHISCLVELKKSNKIFMLAHNLVNLYPNLAISWFAVGCYYYTVGKCDAARQYLAKATNLDRLFGPAWLAYGHSFATENEHDQAMAAYFKASQLMKGCHLPLLYIGLECGLTNNVKLAEKFFQQAQTIAPDDPFVMHEMGVVAFQNLDFKTAEKHFKDALFRIKPTSDHMILPRWEPLLNNLGHTCRKLKQYEEALEYHHQALVLVPHSAGTYSAIGYIHSLMGQTEEAVDWFHKALGLRRDDTFSTTMLNYVIEQLSLEQPSYPGAPDHVSNFQITAPTTEDSTIQGSEDSPSVKQNKMNADVSDMSLEMDMSDSSGAVKE